MESGGSNERLSVSDKLPDVYQRNFNGFTHSILPKEMTQTRRELIFSHLGGFILCVIKFTRPRYDFFYVLDCC